MFLRMGPWSRPVPWLLLAGDVLAVVVFVVIGQNSHELFDPTNPVAGVLKTAAMFALPWALAGWLLGAFPASLDDLQGRPFRLLARSLNAWLVAAPLGALLWALFKGRVMIHISFLAVTLGLAGLFVLGWRLIFVLAWRRLARPTPAASN